VDIQVRLGEAPINDLAPLEVERVSAADERLGIRVEALDAERAKEFEFEAPGGVVITDVQRGSAAAQRNIGPGAKIAQINGRTMGTPDDVRRALDGVDAGEVVSLVLEGPNGRRQIVNVRMPAR